MGTVFDPERLAAIARLGIGLPHDQMCRVVIDELARTYPKHIEPREKWIFNLAAGATGMMTILHASFTEYLILFGSAIGTEGFSGRYLLDIYDFVINGEMWTCPESNHAERIVSKPGDRTLLRKGTSKAYRIIEDTWMLEYGRGFIPTSLPVGLGDATLSAQDFVTVGKTVGIFGRLVLRELLHGKI